jgi:16S rRNA (cytidine1402-2'-O)-methyltransferase
MAAVLRPGIYMVATPIGNLGDLSPRAGEVLAAAAVVAAEDTRTSSLLLRRAGSNARLLSLTEHNAEKRIPELLAVASEAPVAVVSDAGTPVVADPGARLVDAAHTTGVPVFAVPGPSALAAAISVSGFEGSDVHFLGFIAKKRAARVERLKAAAATAHVLVFFESPHRLGQCLGDVALALADPEVVVCRELTKMYEEVVRGRASALAERFKETQGECTVVVRCPEPHAATAAEGEVAAYMQEMRRAGARRAAAASEAARRFGVGRSRAYELWDSPEEP